MSGKRAKLLRKEVIAKHGLKQWTAYADNFGTRVNYGLGRVYKQAKANWKKRSAHV